MCVYLTYLKHLLHGKDIFIHRKKKDSLDYHMWTKI